MPENAPSAQVRILDALCKTVYQNQLNDALNQLDVAHLASGLYCLNMTLPTQEVYHGKVLIQK